MKINEENWLSHLKNFPEEIGGYRSCIYFMALEGWRRGLKLEFHIKPSRVISNGITFSLSDGTKKHHFVVSRGDKVSHEAINICIQKPKTYEYLRKNDIPVPEGNSFSEDTKDKEIIEYAENLGYPLVVKPTDGRSGIGVITDIRDNKEFEKALKKVRNELGFKSVIVERFIKGMDYRVYIVDGKVIGIYKRVPANIIGDGKSSVKELISKKNIIRRKNPFIKNRLIKIDENLIENLQKQNLTLESVIKKRKRVYLRKQGEYLRERDPVDITDTVPEKIKEIAINAVKAIPGLPHCNVDMLVNEETGEGYVNEINSRPQISNHLFPLEGKARDIPSAIMDYYFPETKGKTRNDNYFFEFMPVYESFKKSNISKIVVPDIPLNHKLTRFRLDGDLQKHRYESWVRREFARLKMYGYMMHLSNGQTSIVASGSHRALERFRVSMNNKFLFQGKVKSIREFSRNRPIRLSFNVYTSSTRGKSYKRIKNLKEENKKLAKELKKIKEKYKLVNNSLPLRLYRKIRRIIKK